MALPRLPQSPVVELAAVVFNEGEPVSRAARWKRNFRKSRRIGPLGALNGTRMRRWYGEHTRRWVDVEPISALARRLSVPLLTTGRIGSDITIRHF